MYRPVSPMSHMRVQTLPAAITSTPEIRKPMPNISRSPINYSPQRVVPPPGANSQINVIGNIQAPPGMKTVLKPKIYEAVEIPAGQVPPSSVRQMNTSHVQPYNPDDVKQITQLQNELSQLKRQNQQLQTLLKNNDNGNEWPQKFQELQRDLEAAVHDRNYLQDQMRIITDKMNQEMYQDTNKLKQELEEQKRVFTLQCEQYYKQFKQAEHERNETQQKLKLTEQNLTKIPYLQQLLNESNQKSQALANEINIWKQKYNESEEDRIRQVENLRDEYERLYNQQYEGLKQNADNKCRFLEEEMQRNRQQLDEAIKEAEQWRSRYHQEDLDKLSYTQRISQLELQTLHQQKEIDRLTLTNLQKLQEVESLRQRVNQLEYNHVQTLQPNLETELKRLREQLEARNKELDDLRKRNQQLESICLKNKETEVELDILQQKHNDLQKNYEEVSRFRFLYDQLQHEYEGLQSKYNKLDQQFQEQKRNEHRLQQEIQRLSDLLRVKDDELERQSQSYKRNMLQLQNQVNQFKDQYEKDLQNAYTSRNRNENEVREGFERKYQLLKEDYENLRREREQLLNTCSQLSSTKVQLENKIVQLTGEIERLNQVIRVKYEEHQNLKENYRLVNEQLEQKQNYIDEMRRELMMETTRPPHSYKNSTQQSVQPSLHQKSYESQRPSQKQFEI